MSFTNTVEPRRQHLQHSQHNASTKESLDPVNPFQILHARQGIRSYLMYSLNNCAAYIKHILNTVFKVAKLRFQELGNIRIKILI